MVMGYTLEWVGFSHVYIPIPCVYPPSLRVPSPLYISVYAHTQYVYQHQVTMSWRCTVLLVSE